MEKESSAQWKCSNNLLRLQHGLAELFLRRLVNLGMDLNQSQSLDLLVLLALRSYIPLLLFSCSLAAMILVLVLVQVEMMLSDC